ncbi:Arylacetamide deacetylase [Phaffia rhodozyma]|uniref:Arylacetamide deacetylase n=1 Tax=Phaffia rhodozyma TaxID=264483 RepID=A0A0F7SSJ6_PHARH|nr:Arylacetamide deacetylase [Phaffia rhodozyma]
MNPCEPVMGWFFRKPPANSATPSSTSSATPVGSTADLPSDLYQRLAHYSSPDTPASARIDNSLVQRQGKRFLTGWGVGEVFKLAGFVVAKASHLATELATHTIYGPRKKSWGLEMTIITSMMRDVGAHSHLADIPFIRGLVSLSTLAPLPSSAIVTPFSFRVKSRGLRGLLADFDSYELGGENYDPYSIEGGFGSGREVGGEWVVDKVLWAKWQREWKERRKGGKGGERIVLYLHGGAYYVFSAATHRSITTQISSQCQARVYAINYRLAPETRFPGPLHDAVSAYFRLTDELGVKPENILFAGDSAGGGLVLGTLLYLRDNGYPLPSGAILMSPWVDLTMSCDSWDSNAPFDIVPRPGLDDHLNPVYCYLGEEGVKKYLTHPYASPLFGDFKGLPPLLIQSGEAEVLRDEITLLAHKATLSGTVVRHEVFEDCVHVFQTFPFLEATKIAFESQRDFVLNFLPALPNQFSRSSSSERNDRPNLLDSELSTSQSKLVNTDRQEVPLPEETNYMESSDGENDAKMQNETPKDKFSSETTSLPDVFTTIFTERVTPQRTNSTAQSDITVDDGELHTPLEGHEIKDESLQIADPCESLPRSRQASASFSSPAEKQAVSSILSSSSISKPIRPSGLLRFSTTSYLPTISSPSEPFSSQPSSSSSVVLSPLSRRSRLPFSLSSSPSKTLNRLTTSHATINQLPPTPPKTRSRSASHPEIADLVRSFETGAGDGYAIRRFGPQDLSVATETLAR